MKKYQFVNWFPEWQGIGFKIINPELTSVALIYKWVLWLGFFEVRRWTDSILEIKEEQGK